MCVKLQLSGITKCHIENLLKAISILLTILLNVQSHVRLMNILISGVCPGLKRLRRKLSENGNMIILFSDVLFHCCFLKSCKL